VGSPDGLGYLRPGLQRRPVVERTRLLQGPASDRAAAGSAPSATWKRRGRAGAACDFAPPATLQSTPSTRTPALPAAWLSTSATPVRSSGSHSRRVAARRPRRGWSPWAPKASTTARAFRAPLRPQSRTHLQRFCGFSTSDSAVPRRGSVDTPDFIRSRQRQTKAKHALGRAPGQRPGLLRAH
jgi:hypothetical protein